MIEQAVLRNGSLHTLEDLATRASTMATLLENATPSSQEAVIGSARRSGWDASLQPLSLAQQFTSQSPTEGFWEWVFELLFWPDGKPDPVGGWRTFLNGERVIAMNVGQERLLVLKGIPSAMQRGDFWGQGSSSLIALITLNVLFSIFAIRAITRPLSRMAMAAAQEDTPVSSVHFDERGSVEIVALARALNSMRSRITSMIDSRTRMLHGISHDLRTPLTRIRLRVERVADPELRNALLNDVAGIDKLLEESLTYLRDEHRCETFEKTDLASLLQTICSEFTDSGNVIAYRGPNRLTANFRPLAMTRAVTNLCENAVKFGHEVRVDLNASVDAITIDVMDDGPGISKADRDRVLEPFYKADLSRSAEHSGFGLGLSIVDEIIQDHRGKIEFLDRLPNGLIARVTLPYG